MLAEEEEEALIEVKCNNWACPSCVDDDADDGYDDDMIDRERSARTAT
jgi:hypothetical protein